LTAIQQVELRMELTFRCELPKIES